MNGIGSIAAACFGSCFPTTIYIGHPGWKAMGARAGYSVLNAVFATVVCLTGTVSHIAWGVPDRRRHGDRAVDRHRHHRPGVPGDAARSTRRPWCSACCPGVGAWGALMAKNGLRAAGVGIPGGPPFSAALIPAFQASDTWIGGAFALEQGFIFTAMILSAATVAHHRAALRARAPPGARSAAGLAAVRPRALLSLDARRHRDRLAAGVGMGGGVRLDGALAARGALADDRERREPLSAVDGRNA